MFVSTINPDMTLSFKINDDGTTSIIIENQRVAIASVTLDNLQAGDFAAEILEGIMKLPIPISGILGKVEMSHYSILRNFTCLDNFMGGEP